jgi:adenosylcobinamide-GDP ribazoletransferase
MAPRIDDRSGTARVSFPMLLAQAVRFLSRIPVPRLPGEVDPHQPPDLARGGGVLPLAGVVIGAVGGLTMALAVGVLHLPALAAAALAVGSLVLVTGGLHEDGLADTADGLGGGSSPARRLAIMSDSQIGAYGATAIGLSLILRVSLLAGLAGDMGASVGFVVVAAAAVSRAGALAPLWLLPAAKAEGRSAAVGRPGDGVMALAIGGALAIALALLGWRFGIAHVLAACGAAFLAVLPLTALARRLIGGQTGDIAGAAQQLSEIAFLTILAARWGA